MYPVKNHDLILSGERRHGTPSPHAWSDLVPRPSTHPPTEGRSMKSAGTRHFVLGKTVCPPASVLGWVGSVSSHTWTESTSFGSPSLDFV